MDAKSSRGEVGLVTVRRQWTRERRQRAEKLNQGLAYLNRQAGKGTVDVLTDQATNQTRFHIRDKGRQVQEAAQRLRPMVHPSAVLASGFGGSALMSGNASRVAAVAAHSSGASAASQAFAPVLAGVAVVSAVGSAAQLCQQASEKEALVAGMVRDAPGAQRVVTDGSTSQADLAAYRRFVSASRALNGKKRGRLSKLSDRTLKRRAVVLGAGKSGLGVAASMGAVAGAFGAAGAAPVAPLVNGLAGVVEIGMGAVQAAEGARKAKSARAVQQGLRHWAADAAGESGDFPSGAVQQALNREVKRQKKAGLWAHVNGIFQSVKGGISAATGLTGGALIAAAGATAALGAASVVLTAGIALYAVMLGVGVAFGAYMLVRTIRSRRSDRHARLRQKQAQVIAANYSPLQMKQMLAGRFPGGSTVTVVTAQRAGLLGLGRKRIRVDKADAASNGYIALKVAAHEIASCIQHDSMQQDDQFSRLLASAGISGNELELLRLESRDMTAGERAFHIEKLLAKGWGIPLLLDEGGREKDMSDFSMLSRFADPVNDGASRQPSMQGLDFYRCAQAMDRLAPHLRMAKPGSAAARAANWYRQERRRRSDLLETHFGPQSRYEVVAVLVRAGMSPRSAHAMSAFLAVHAKYLRDDPSAAVAQLQGASKTGWFAEWQMAEQQAGLMGRGWMQAARDALSWDSRQP